MWKTLWILKLHERLNFFMWMKLYVADVILPFKVKLAEPMEFLNINCMSSFVEQWNVQLFIFLESVNSKRFLLWIQMGFLCRCLSTNWMEDFILRIISPHKFLVEGIDSLYFVLMVVLDCWSLGTLWNIRNQILYNKASHLNDVSNSTLLNPKYKI